jgi:DDE superfamily endonuclease
VTINKKTQEHINSLTDFRQQVCALFENQHDALFEITDAVIQTSAARSYAELSLAPAFTRKWPSLYSALADGSIDIKGLRELCLNQVPRTQARIHFAIDVMAVRRMNSPTLKDRVFCHGAKREVSGTGIIIGLPFSILAYVEQRGTSWAPSLHTQRVKPDQSAVEVAVKQASWIAEQLPAKASPEIALDGSYGNLKFFRAIRGVRCFATARMRNDRVLYQIPQTPPAGEKKPGRPPKYGPEFHFADPQTWPTPDEVYEFEDAKHGRVRLELWSDLRFRTKKEEIVDISTVARSQIHLERDKPPAPHWYGVHNGTTEETTLARIYECITHRWPIEPANRFRKERLYAELPKVRQAEASDLWLQLLQVIEWELYLWRPMASDAHLPWQKPLAHEQLTPGRVIRSLSENLGQVGTPVSPVLPRGKSPGWPSGRVRTAPATYKLESKKRKKALEMSKNE